MQKETSCVYFEDSFCGKSDSVFSKDALLSHGRERKRTGIPLNPCLVGRREVPTSRLTSKVHRMTSETQQRHCARSSVTNVLSLEQNSPQPTSLSILLEIHEINFEENWRYRTLSIFFKIDLVYFKEIRKRGWLRRVLL